MRGSSNKTRDALYTNTFITYDRPILRVIDGQARVSLRSKPAGETWKWGFICTCYRYNSEVDGTETVEKRARKNEKGDDEIALFLSFA